MSSSNSTWSASGKILNLRVEDKVNSSAQSNIAFFMSTLRILRVFFMTLAGRSN